MNTDESFASQSIKNSLPLDPERSSLSYLVKLFAVLAPVLIVLIGAGTWYQWRSQSSTNIQAETAAKSALSGDYANARKQAEDILLKTNRGGETYAIANAVLGVSSYWGTDVNGQLQAVRLTKQEYLANQGNPKVQAFMIDRLFGYAIASSYDPAVVNEIFSGQPFNSLSAPATTTNKFVNLAQLSLSLYPTSNAIFQMAMSKTSRIVKNYDKPRSIAAAKVEADAAFILDSIQKAEQLYSEESAMASTYVFGVLYHPTFLFSEGYLYGIVSLLHPEYLAKSEAAFTRANEYYETVVENARAAGTQKPAMVEMFLPNMHLNAALFIHAKGGVARAADVTTHLDEIAQIVGSDPATHRLGFIAFIRKLSENQSTFNSGYWFFNPARVGEIAAFSQDFKTLLQNNGWKF